jgi:predicted nucleotidyltransferase
MPTKLDRDYVAERLRGAEGEIRALGVRRLALFGSFVRGEAGDDSDVDFLVEFAPGQKSFDRFLDLADLLERAVGRRVDLLTTESLSPHIGPHILAEAADVLRLQGGSNETTRRALREAEARRNLVSYQGTAELFADLRIG